MSISSLAHLGRQVLERHWDIGPSTTTKFLGSHGGFSGAFLWRVRASPETLCLKAWPTGSQTPERLSGIHRLMRLASEAGLDFVPRVVPTSKGPSVAESGARCWDLTSWMPGQADFHAQPTPRRLQAACEALGRLHLAWKYTSPTSGPCPAVLRRLEMARDWIHMLKSGWVPAFSHQKDNVVQPWAEKTWQMLQSRIDSVIEKLKGWADQTVPLQPCLCDVWHDHVFYDGDQLTGLIDYGGVKTDHIAVDLARLLGSMAPDNAALRNAGLEAYARLRPLTLEEEELIEILDKSGTVLGAANWLTWIYREKRHYEDLPAVAKRLAALVGRTECWDFFKK